MGQDNLIYIYALIDPLTDSIKYIGKSLNPAFRLKCHIQDITNIEKHTWIKELIEQSLMPKIEILETIIDNKIALKRETYYIREAIKGGYVLFNRNYQSFKPENSTFVDCLIKNSTLYLFEELAEITGNNKDELMADILNNYAVEFNNN